MKQRGQSHRMGLRAFQVLLCLVLSWDGTAQERDLVAVLELEPRCGRLGLDELMYLIQGQVPEETSRSG